MKHIGDRVKTLVNIDEGGTKRFPIGTIGIVSGVNFSNKYPYKVHTYDDEFWFYKGYELELVVEKENEKKKTRKKL